MKNTVETVTIFRTWVDLADTLKDAERGKLYHAICRYSLYGEEPALEKPLDSFFELMRPTINKSNARKIAQQIGVQNRSQNRPPNDLQNGSQNRPQNGSQNNPQKGCIRARKTGTGTGTGKEKGSKEPAKEILSFVNLIPAKLQDEAFKKAWVEWETEKRQQRKKLTPLAAQKQLNLLAAYSIKDAIEMLENSIRNGYQGLFPLDNQPRRAAAAKPNRDHSGV